MRTVLPCSHHELHLVISLPVPYHASPADVPVRVRRVTEKCCFDEGESGTNSGQIFLKSLPVTLLICFFFWLHKSWFGRKRELSNILSENNTPPKSCRLSLSFYHEKKSNFFSNHELCLALRLGHTGWRLSEEQEATGAGLWQRLWTVPRQGSPHCTILALEMDQQTAN